MNLKELEARVKVLEDIEQIKQLQIQYVNFLTTCKWDDLVGCFADNAVTDISGSEVTRGKLAIAKQFKEKIAKGHVGLEGNFVVHPIISVDGDKAKGSWLLYIQSALGRKRSTGEEAPDWTQGYYDMEYVKEDGTWKISLLRWKSRLTSPRPH